METANSKSKTHFQTNVASEHWLNLGGRDFRLVGKTIRIGRAEDNDIVLDDKSISRYHAIISILPDQIVLEDLKSRNGTKVNSNPIRRSELSDGDEVAIGELAGMFYLRYKNQGIKNPLSNPQQELKKIGIEVSKVFQGFQGANDLKARWARLTKKQKQYAIGGVVGFFVLLMMLSSGSQNSVVETEQATAAEVPVVVGSIDKADFDRCLQFEDLGSFRQAMACLKQMKHTSDVKRAIDRIQERQSDLSEKRFKEGQQAYTNYYYDVAIQKWQEVLLIADDDSKFWAEASRGIEEAEKKRRGQ